MRNFGNSLAAEQPVFSKLDLRVGVIVKVWEHPRNSDVGTENSTGDPENSDVGTKLSDEKPQNPP